MKLDVYEYTNRGGRSYNEDSVAHKILGENGLFVVADGLGGHRYGELASSCVCETLVEEWDGKFDRNPADWLYHRIAAANKKVLSLQAEKNDVLKSTVAALAVEGTRAAWANVGDSRIYYIHHGEIAGITNDHSVAFKKYKAGEITRDGLRTDEDQSALLRSLGSEDRSEAEMYCAPKALESGDAFMLCSDGVWEYISDEEVLIDYFKAASAEQWAEHLLLRLMNRISGGNDNLSILTVMVV